MKKLILSIVWLAALLLGTSSAQAQSLKDLFNKETLSKVVDAVTGHTSPVEMVGTWNFESSAIEFKSDNLLKKAGGAAAAAIAETKLDEELQKIGIKKGQMSFTFTADSTFTCAMGKRTMKGTYSYNTSVKEVNLKYLKIINLSAKMNYSTDSMELLFNSDKLLKLLVFLGSKSNSTAMKAISALGKEYDGMMLGFELHK